MKPTNYKLFLTSGAREIAQWLLRNQSMPKKAILRYRFKKKTKTGSTCKKETNQFNANEILKHILSWFAKLTLAEDWTGR